MMFKSAIYNLSHLRKQPKSMKFSTKHTPMVGFDHCLASFQQKKTLHWSYSQLPHFGQNGFKNRKTKCHTWCKIIYHSVSAVYTAVLKTVSTSFETVWLTLSRAQHQYLQKCRIALLPAALTTLTYTLMWGTFNIQHRTVLRIKKWAHYIRWKPYQ